jgi:hypothetical protein
MLNDSTRCCMISPGLKVTESLSGTITFSPVLGFAQEGCWMEALVEDKTAGPDAIAASRIDVADWFQSLPRRTRKIAKTLATGETTGRTAKMFGVSAGRISQFRRELQRSWEDFVGETVPAMA